MFATSHDAFYQPPPGKGYNADDLANAEQLKLADALKVTLPALMADGVSVYLDELRQEEKMRALDRKLAESLPPELQRQARELFRSKASETLKLEQAQIALKTANSPPPPAAVAAASAAKAEAEQGKPNRK